MPTATQPNVFISYASADRRLAELIYKRLTAAGFHVWFDIEQLKPGYDWHKEIEQACEACRVVLPVLTPRWKTSEWTKFETYGAEAIIPLLCEGNRKDVFTPPLVKWQDLPLDATNPNDAAWDKLFAQLKTILAQPLIDKTQRLTAVRYRANPYFVGRERDLERIHEALHENPTAVLTQGRVRAITALGGIGKTTLARQFIEKFWRCYPQIFCVASRNGT